MYKCVLSLGLKGWILKWRKCHLEAAGWKQPCGTAVRLRGLNVQVFRPENLQTSPLGVYSTGSISKPASAEPVIAENFNDVTHQSPAKVPSDLCFYKTNSHFRTLDAVWSNLQLSCRIVRTSRLKKVRLESALSFTFLSFTAWSQTGVACSCGHFSELQ